MDVKRWPRKNDAGSIRARQEALGLDGVTGIDLSPFARAQEMLTGAAVIPVSVVGPLELELGEYELEEPVGARRRDRPGPRAGLRPARAHRGRSVGLALPRRPRGRRVGRLPHLRARRPDHARLLLRLHVDGGSGAARAVPRSARRRDARWLAERRTTGSPSYAQLREVKTHVVGPMCHVLWRSRPATRAGRT